MILKENCGTFTSGMTTVLKDSNWWLGEFWWGKPWRKSDIKYESRMFVSHNFSSQITTGFQKAAFEKLCTDSCLVIKNTPVPYFLMDRASLAPHWALLLWALSKPNVWFLLVAGTFTPHSSGSVILEFLLKIFLLIWKKQWTQTPSSTGNLLLTGACCESLLSLWAICLHFLRVKLTDKQLQNQVTVKSKLS